MSRYDNLWSTVASVASGCDAVCRILEIGVWRGDHSALMINEALKHVPHVEYYGFDLFEDHARLATPAEIGKSKPPLSQTEIFTKLRGESRDIHLIKGDSKRTLPRASLPLMDFIFIDGGHSLETIASDWRHVQRFVDDRTVILLDDYYENRTDAGCAFVTKSPCGYHFEILDPIDHFDHHGGLSIRMVRACRSSGIGNGT